MPKPEWINPGLVALVEILNRVEKEPYHWPVGRTAFQKMAFIATLEGIPTGLQYHRGSYGPFSTDLKGLISRLINNGLIREQPKGRMFEVVVGPTYPDARLAYQKDFGRWDDKINKVANLFLRLDTNKAEIVSTILFAAQDLYKDKQKSPTETDVLEEVMNWKQRRRPPLEIKEVANAIRKLAALNWLKVKGSQTLPLPQEDWDDS
jgi:uncharacterized protein YwgA